MIERLLIPSWNAPPRPLDDWLGHLDRLGIPARVERDDSEETWLILDPIATRMLAVIEGPVLSALHAEIEAADPAEALETLDRAAAGIGWEVHDEQDDEDDDGA